MFISFDQMYCAIETAKALESTAPYERAKCALSELNFDTDYMPYLPEDTDWILYIRLRVDEANDDALAFCGEEQ